MDQVRELTAHGTRPAMNEDGGPPGRVIWRLCGLAFFDLLQDLPPQPRYEELRHLVVRRGQIQATGPRRPR
jgi:hypothetical protein